MNTILDFIVANKDSIFIIAIAIVAFFAVGRKRAMNFVATHFNTVKGEILINVEKYAPVYSNYIYGLLPKSARLFVTTKGIEKYIHKIIATLDKWELQGYNIFIV